MKRNPAIALAVESKHYHVCVRGGESGRLEDSSEFSGSVAWVVAHLRSLCENLRTNPFCIQSSESLSGSRSSSLGRP
jgi:hypothetical protein